MCVCLQGLTALLGTLPSWLNYTDKEKVEWLNSVLTEVRAVQQQNDNDI